MVDHHFIGDREKPMHLASVRRQRDVKGTGKMPEALQALVGKRIVYVESTEKPHLKIESMEKMDRNIWKIEVPINEGLNGALLGRTMERHPPSKFLKDVKEPVSFTSYKPDWIDARPIPRVMFERIPHFLRRFNGNRVEPLWVYDNARYAFEDSSWPWGLVGRIFNDQGYSGTGILIGDRLVATASHMVPWSSSPWWMRFVPAYFNGASLFGAGVESYVSDARGYDMGGGTGYDWAILRLYEPLGNWLGYFGYNSYSTDWNNLAVWSNIGYPGDIANAEQPAYQSGFTINDVDGDNNGGEELETENCDLNHGNSGGPIFAWWNNGTDPRIVGVVSAQEIEDNGIYDNFFAGGDGFVNLCAWGRSNWPL